MGNNGSPMEDDPIESLFLEALEPTKLLFQGGNGGDRMDVFEEVNSFPDISLHDVPRAHADPPELLQQQQHSSQRPLPQIGSRSAATSRTASFNSRQGSYGSLRSRGSSLHSDEVSFTSDPSTPRTPLSANSSLTSPLRDQTGQNATMFPCFNDFLNSPPTTTSTPSYSYTNTSMSSNSTTTTSPSQGISIPTRCHTLSGPLKDSPKQTKQRRRMPNETTFRSPDRRRSRANSAGKCCGVCYAELPRGQLCSSCKAAKEKLKFQLPHVVESSGLELLCTPSDGSKVVRFLDTAQGKEVLASLQKELSPNESRILSGLFKQMIQHCRMCSHDWRCCTGNICGTCDRELKNHFRLYHLYKEYIIYRDNGGTKSSHEWLSDEKATEYSLGNNLGPLLIKFRNYCEILDSDLPAAVKESFREAVEQKVDHVQRLYKAVCTAVLAEENITPPIPLDTISEERIEKLVASALYKRDSNYKLVYNEKTQKPQKENKYDRWGFRVTFRQLLTGQPELLPNCHTSRTDLQRMQQQQREKLKQQMKTSMAPRNENMKRIVRQLIEMGPEAWGYIKHHVDDSFPETVRLASSSASRLPEKRATNQPLAPPVSLVPTNRSSSRPQPRLSGGNVTPTHRQAGFFLATFDGDAEVSQPDKLASTLLQILLDMDPALKDLVMLNNPLVKTVDDGELTTVTVTIHILANASRESHIGLEAVIQHFQTVDWKSKLEVHGFFTADPESITLESNADDNIKSAAQSRAAIMAVDVMLPNL